MVLIAIISVGIVITALAGGISWLALRMFFFMLRRGLPPLTGQELNGHRDDLMEEVEGLPGLAA